MSASELWPFFVAGILAVLVTVVALISALLIHQRHRLALQREYGRQLMAAQDEERAWVAREVHDDILQHLAVIGQQCEQAADRATAESVRTDLGAVRDQLRDVATALRGIAHRMHPAILQRAGIGAALTQLAREVGANLGLVVEVQNGVRTEPPPGVALAVYRVAQEALQNVHRHAGVSTAVLSSRETPAAWSLRVADQGRGIAPRRPGGTSLGLISIEERAAMVGGSIRIESAPDRGTVVELVVPKPTAIG